MCVSVGICGSVGVQSPSLGPMPQALKPQDLQALLRTMLCFAGYPDQDSEPRVQVTSDDEKGSSRQVQALKTNQNETIRGEELLPQHDGPAARARSWVQYKDWRDRA